MSRRRKSAVVDLCSSSDSAEEEFVPSGAHAFGERDAMSAINANESVDNLRSPLKRLRRLIDAPVRLSSLDLTPDAVLRR